MEFLFILTTKNVANFKPVDFVSVGIGPLHYDTKFVENREPHKRLTNDIKFLAERMRARMPPLMVSHKDKIKKIINFMTNHPRMTPNLQNSLCEVIKEKANDASIFSKTSKHDSKL